MTKNQPRSDLAEQHLVEIATDGRWSLFVDPVPIDYEWSQYVLRDLTTGERFWVSHNGRRATSASLHPALLGAHPQTHAAVGEIIEDHSVGKRAPGERWQPQIPGWSRPKIKNRNL